jgi:DNA polymerase delta subunit 3
MVDRESDEDEEGDGGEAERSLRAMMDIDDDQVTRVTRDPPSTAHPTESEASPASLPHDEDEDVDMAAADEEPKIKPQPRKKKPKKVIPVGRNGLKKRRVEKSRTSFDEKGYMVTEDYSSYESVTDVDEADDLPAKAKGKTKEGPKLVEKKTTKEDPPVESVSKPKALGKAPSTGKAAASSTTKSKMGGSSKGDIKNFFAKK